MCMCVCVHCIACACAPEALDDLLRAVEAGGGDGVAFVLQHPGDLVFVPEFWGHAVLNLGDVISVAFELFD
jgi:hypothetical protein